MLLDVLEGIKMCFDPCYLHIHLAINAALLQESEWVLWAQEAIDLLNEKRAVVSVLRVVRSRIHA